MESVLPKERFPHLRRIREKHVLFRKLVDVNIVEPGWKLFLDADTLFFRHPVEVVSLLSKKAPFSLVDAPMEGFLTLPATRISSLVSVNLERAKRCNSGLISIDSNSIDWDWVEFCLEQMLKACGGLAAIRGARYHVLEQTTYAIIFSTFDNFQYLPEYDYSVHPTYRQIKTPTHVFSHYIGSTERFFAYNAMRDVFGVTRLGEPI